MTIEQIAGVSLKLWDPDEGILADNINLRERKYGGLYNQDYFGASTPSPIITFASSGGLYGQKTYGFDSYAAVLGVSLVQDSSSVVDSVITFDVSLISNNSYNSGTYGFMPYLEVDKLIEENIAVQDLFSPTITISLNGSFYGNSLKYGLINYGAFFTNPISTLNLSESIPTITLALSSGVVYGDGTKYGFGEWQA